MAEIAFMSRNENLEDTDDGGYDYEIQQFEQYDKLGPCERLEKYASSDNPFCRGMVPLLLLETIQESSAEVLSSGVETLMNILSKLAKDGDKSVRVKVIMRIPQLAAACQEYYTKAPLLLTANVTYLLPMLVSFLGDPESNIRKSTYMTLLSIMEQALMPKEAIEEQVCPKVLEYSYANNMMDHQTGAVQLMGKMVPLLGRETTERLFLDSFAELCSNPMFYVRKICASSFGEFCAVVGSGAYESILLPCFIKLCEDEVWGVRKACAEVIMPVSCACSPASRKSTLAQAFAKLLQDQSKWVRISAFHTLGPFISTFADPSIIGLTYNNVGDLVLINQEGTEFKINSPAFTDSKLGYQPQEAITNRFSYSTNDDNDVVDTKELFKNLLGLDEDDEDQDIKDTTTDNNLGYLFNGINLEENKSETKITIEDFDKMFLTNALLENNDHDDDLNKYNQHQYWYISPDLPLDPDILDSCKPADNNCDKSSEKFMQKLEDLSLNSTWNNTLEEPKNDLTNDGILDTKMLDSTLVNGQTEEKDELLNEEKENKEEDKNQDIVPQILIDHFTSMTDSQLATDSTDNDVAYHCAFSLPAVALTLGRNNWHLLKKTYETLAGDMHYKVRKTVASSLHELARILGQEMAEEHLVPIFHGFIKDVDEVRIGILKHLAHFLKLIGPEKRHECLPRLTEFFYTDKSSNWRFREDLANQLLLAVPILESIKSLKLVVLYAVDLLSDKVYAVRKVALTLMTELTRNLSSHPQLLKRQLIKLAEVFGHTKQWVHRQTFVFLCASFITSNAVQPEIFATEILPHLLDLSWDPVPNVRLAVSRTLSRDIITHEYFMKEKQESLQQVLKRMQNDKDRDVRYFAVLSNNS